MKFYARGVLDREDSQVATQQWKKKETNVGKCSRDYSDGKSRLGDRKAIQGKTTAAPNSEQ